MKKSAYILSSALIAGLAFTSCESENEFKIVGAPYITITMDGKTVATLDDAQQYTLNLESNQYTNAAKDNVLAASKFDVRSNLRWKLTPVEEGNSDWLTPFPAEGEKDGMFFFKADRNIDPVNAREAYYNICVDKGNGFEALPGMLVINQKASAKFFEYTPANSNIESTARNFRVYVYSNVDWTYDIEPMSDYATENLDWIVDTNYHVASKQIDTLLFRVSANNGSIRGFNVNLHYSLNGEETTTETIPVTQYSATEASVEGLPVQWVIGIKTGINYTDTWPGSGYINATTGSGQISYYSSPDKPDVNNKFSRVVGGGGDPYVTGAWPGDYWEFKNDSPVAAGSILKISFETRVSGTGQKYWRLEYKDGDEFKIVGTSKTTSIAATSNYQAQDNVVYTHEMESDGSTNIQVSSVVKYENTTDAAVFRFVCAANYQASGNGPLAAPNGGTCRLTLTDNTSTEGYPTISCVAAGSEEIKTADITVSGVNDGLMTFEGTPAAAQSFSVTSSEDFTVTTSDSWINVDVASGLAETETTVNVSCDNNVSVNVRRGKVDIKSGVSHYYIYVVQSAAGADFDPLLSIVGGNTKSFGYDPSEFTVQTLANVPVSYEIVGGGDWLTSADGMTTTAMVEKTEYKFAVTSNKESYVERTARIRFYNEQYGLESVLAVTQSGVTPLCAEWLFTAATYTGGVHSAFQTAAGTAAAKAAGDGGAYVSSNVKGNGNIYWYNGVDKTGIDGNDKAARSIGTTGHPLIAGAWPGDYWLFTATDDSEYAAGTKVHISFITRVSAGGQKYWMLEYWDGQAWQPVYDNVTATIGDETVTYNFLPAADGKTNTKVDFTWTLAAPCKVMQFRYSCVANYTAKSKVLDAPDGGSCRIAGADGTSPVFEVVSE